MGIHEFGIVVKRGLRISKRPLVVAALLTELRPVQPEPYVFRMVRKTLLIKPFNFLLLAQSDEQVALEPIQKWGLVNPGTSGIQHGTSFAPAPTLPQPVGLTGIALLVVRCDADGRP